MTEILCYAGQQMVYEEASETIGKLTGTVVNSKQIERLCHHYGQELENDQQQNIRRGVIACNNSKEPHYVMLDGGMILTREESWKELKLGRIFSSKEPVQLNKERGHIPRSQYIGHLGNHHDFLNKMEYYTDGIKKKIFIADGAKWIWKWADETYPDSPQILDFFHAKEHLCQFAEQYFKDESERTKWIDRQSLRLLNDKVENVITDLDALFPKDKKTKDMLAALIQYYLSNTKRMQYKTFKENGWLIGSGAIEAAIRHVVQKRLKLSGQRWTIPGAQQVLNLRMAHKSVQWEKVQTCINMKIAA